MKNADELIEAHNRCTDTLRVISADQELLAETENEKDIKLLRSRISFNEIKYIVQRTHLATIEINKSSNAFPISKETKNLNGLVETIAAEKKLTEIKPAK